jgi:uncharacterized membrane protein
MWQRGGARLVLPLPEGALLVDDVAGVALDGTTVGIYFGASHRERCFRTSPTGPALDLGMMGNGDVCAAYAVNRKGQIAGMANRQPNSTEFYAFIWSEGVFHELDGLPGSTSSYAVALNDRGEAVGASGNHAVLWSHGRIQDLDPGSNFSQATSINNSGVAVGTGAGALRFDANGPVPLASEVADLGDWQLNEAFSINDDGVIVGWGSRAGVPHGFMLVPQP